MTPPVAGSGESTASAQGSAGGAGGAGGVGGVGDEGPEEDRAPPDDVCEQIHEEGEDHAEAGDPDGGADLGDARLVFRCDHGLDEAGELGVEALEEGRETQEREEARVGAEAPQRGEGAIARLGRGSGRGAHEMSVGGRGGCGNAAARVGTSRSDADRRSP